ncbi:IS982 family transposase, partial [Photobacterium phosphoreum]
YTRMLKLMQTVLVPLSSYFTHRRAQPTVIAFINSIKLIVCHNLRIPRHKVFDSIAERDCGSKSDR